MDTKIARNLSIKQIRAFVSVAEHQSFSRAAKALAISQPALTLSVQQLEDIVGAALLKRTTRFVSLTQQGQEFRPKAEKILCDIEAAVLSARASAIHQKNRVKIATLPSVAVRVLPAAMRDYADTSPETKISVQDDNGRGVQAQVLSHEADFGISNIWSDEADLQFTPFMRDQLGLICRGDHPLAKQKPPLTWASLEGHPFVGMAPDTGISRLAKSVEGLPEGVTDPAYTVLTIAALVGLVENGEAISALPALSAPDYLNPALVYRGLREPVLHRELCLITAKGRPLSAAAKGFRDFLLNHSHRISATFPNNTVGCMAPSD
ncbi:LysR family transcriptional regulator [Leisingera sp. HS039]|uniref:LysR family transcriptional regulator n=1 Tax=unclassified Leisingera TaxID=2614906 RepID=UPI001070B96D|nr:MULTISPECIES: LysR family transcriptional regulator [unclassified Leisingera]MBQ4827556.1 LysR family transcriptional regulator [Leisingera sp. HS039]QBR37833.1 LysR family transcriptional regulator [Leisingera sp. NJS201]